MIRAEVEGLNPAVLRWARERSGRSVDEVAKKLGKPAALVEAWEEGSSAPTYPELERLAYDVVKRPLAVFFFPTPPPEPKPDESFRTLPGFEVEKLTAHTRLAIRRARADQLALGELFAGRNPAERPLLMELRVDPRGDVADIAQKLRAFIGVTLEEQSSTWRSEREALDRWREAFERVGLFVFKAALKQRSISGFCLYDASFPVIVLNNSTSLTRQIFTLVHEVGHLLSRTGGITLGDSEYLRALRGESRDIEVFCNRFAAEVLVPMSDLKVRARAVQPTDSAVAALARTYRVSREVVLRRFLDLGLVSASRYEEKAREWTADFERTSEGGGGGDFYRTQASYLSPRLLGEVMRRYLRGAIDASDAASFLGVKPAHIAGLEDVVIRKIGA